MSVDGTGIQVRDSTLAVGPLRVYRNRVLRQYETPDDAVKLALLGREPALLVRLNILVLAHNTFRRETERMWAPNLGAVLTPGADVTLLDRAILLERLSGSVRSDIQAAHALIDIALVTSETEHSTSLIALWRFRDEVASVEFVGADDARAQQVAQRWDELKADLQ